MHGNRHIGFVLKTGRCFDLSLRSLSVSSRLWRGWYYSSLETWDTFGCRTKHSTFKNTNINIGKTKYKHRKDKYNCRQRQIHILAKTVNMNEYLRYKQIQMNTKGGRWFFSSLGTWFSEKQIQIGRGVRSTFQNESALDHKLWQAADSFCNRYFEICFFGHLIFLLMDRILSHSPNFGLPKQGPKDFLDFLNFFFEYWVHKDFLVVCPDSGGTCPEKFSGKERFMKNSVFHGFPCPCPKKKYRAGVPAILMPPTFPIASLNGYTPNFSGKF